MQIVMIWLESITYNKKLPRLATAIDRRQRLTTLCHCHLKYESSRYAKKAYLDISQYSCVLNFLFVCLFFLIISN